MEKAIWEDIMHLGENLESDRHWVRCGDISRRERGPEGTIRSHSFQQ